MCYPVCGMVHIKEPLLLIDKEGRKEGNVLFNDALNVECFTICYSSPLNYQS